MFGYACALFAVLGCVRVVTFGYGRTARGSKKFCVNAGKWLTLCKQYNYMERVRLTKEEKARLLSIIESQQRTIETLAELTKKANAQTGAAAGCAAVG